MNDITQEIASVHEIVNTLKSAFDEIQQPRSDFQIQHFVVGEKDTEPARYAQCVLEMQIKYNAIRRSQIKRKKIEAEIKRLRSTGDEIDSLDADEKDIDIEDLDLALLGALREFTCLFKIFQAFSKKFSYEEIQEDQASYWQLRAIRQTCNAISTVGPGQAEMLRQMGLEFQGVNEKGQLQFMPITGQARLAGGLE